MYPKCPGLFGVVVWPEQVDAEATAVLRVTDCVVVIITFSSVPGSLCAEHA
jgi:hypothetical protein